MQTIRKFLRASKARSAAGSRAVQRATQNEIRVASQLGCTAGQVRAGFKRNRVSLGRMAAKAEATGSKVNGFTAAQLRNMEAGHGLR